MQGKQAELKAKIQITSCDYLVIIALVLFFIIDSFFILFFRLKNVSVLGLWSVLFGSHFEANFFYNFISIKPTLELMG